MTWHLKDRELEKKLIEICPNFIECIDFAIQTKEKDADYIYVEFDRERENVTLGFNYLYFWDDEFEYILEYNPKDWNEYPKVIPPRHEPLRVEFADKSGTKAFFDDCLREYVTAKRIDRPCRYRPWED